MPLPDIQLPGGFPPFKSDDHTLKPEPVYGMVRRQAGAPRSRRLFAGAAPTVVEATLELSSTQLIEFHNFYTFAIVGGALPFSARVAKIGSGLEWWEAYCVGQYSAKILEGNLHEVRLKLRLMGSPSATGPAAAQFTAEAYANLYFDPRSDIGNGLFAEAFAALSITVDLGPLLAAEAYGRLYTVIDGGPANPSMDAEAFCHAETAYAFEPAAQFEAEAWADLNTTFYADTTLAAEASASLSVTVGALTGYVASPADITVAFTDYGFGSSTPRLIVRANGTVAYDSPSLGLTAGDNWYSPTTVNVGTGHYARMVEISSSGAGLPPANLNVMESLSTSKTWAPSNSYEPTYVFHGRLSIYSDPDGTNLVSEFDYTLTWEVIPSGGS